MKYYNYTLYTEYGSAFENIFANTHRKEGELFILESDGIESSYRDIIKFDRQELSDGREPITPIFT
jgi:hypothetical protein